MATRRLASVVIRAKGRTVRVWSRPELFAPQRAPAGEPLRSPPADPPAPAEGAAEARRALDVQR